ncbi:MAG: preprotein translocase subunit SecG [Patescibacteria group bacterium]
MQILQELLPWLQIGLSLLLIVTILLQQNEAGLGSAFGGSNSGGVAYTKRGLEKLLFLTSIILAILFVVVAIGQFLLAA